jgi:cell division protein FtsN
MTGRRNAQDMWSRFGLWIACACVSLCWVSPTLSAQTRSVTPPPAAAPAAAPVACAAPAPAASGVSPGRVIASAGDIASKSGSKPGANGATKPRQWTVQVASFESLQDAQSMQQSLCGHGYEARVVGAARPYVVRVGRFSTSQDALVAARHLSTPKLTVFVTQAEH